MTKDAAGGVYVSLTGRAAGGDPERTCRRLAAPAPFCREFDVFRRIAAGETIAEIAQVLSVSVKTASTYKARILVKMQIPHEAALVRYAMLHKLIDEDDNA